MITSSTLDEAIRLLEQLQTNPEQKAIHPIRGTSVEYICKNSMPLDTSSMADIMGSSKAGLVDGESAHDVAFESIMEATLKSLMRVRNTTKLVANPMIEQLVDAVSGAGKNAEERYGQTWTVLPIYMFDWMKDTLLLQQVMTHKETLPKQLKPIYPKWESESAFRDDLHKGLSLYGKSVQEAMDKHIDNIGFGDIMAITERVNHVMSAMGGAAQVEDLDALMMVALANTWMETPPNANVSLHDLDAITADMIADGCRSIYHSYKRHNSAIDRGVLVKHVNSYDRTIVVYGENYRKYIKDHNGTYESTVGFAIFIKGQMLNEAVESIQRCESAYRNDMVIHNRKVATEIDRLRRDVARTELNTLYKDFAGEYGEDGEIINLINKNLGLLDGIGNSDIYLACRKIICRSFFYKNPYIEKLMKEIDRIGEENPNEDINVIALYAFNGLVVEWCVDQIEAQL